MTARVWTARATPANAERYRRHFEAEVLPSLQAVDGYAGATLMQRNVDGETELVVVTRWRSIDAVRGFAGADVDAAVVADDAQALLRTWDRRVRYYDVASDHH